jgi:hypothetical protein
MAFTVFETTKALPFDIPFIGAHISRVGRAIDLFAAPCSPSAEIWVYGFFTAIPTLFATLLKPELIDINIRHRPGKPRRGKRLRFIAERVFRGVLIEIPVPRWVVFRIYEWGQRIGWYMLVADATEQFAINWMSLAYKYNGCTSVQLCYFHGEAVHSLIGAGGAGGWRRIAYLSTGSSLMNFPTTGIQPAVNGKFNVSYTAAFSDYHVPSQSQIPTLTAWRVSGVISQQQNVQEGPGAFKYASGATFIDVPSSPRPIVAVMAFWPAPNKFAYLDGAFAFDREGDDQLGADP